MRRITAALPAIGLWLAVGCAKQVEMLALGRVTAIVVTTSQAQPLKTIEDPAQIAQIVAFVDAQHTGWHTPWTGVSAPLLLANFYDGDEFKGRVGIGEDSFEAQVEGESYAKLASVKDREAFCRLLGVALPKAQRSFRGSGS